MSYNIEERYQLLKDTAEEKWYCRLEGQQSERANSEQ